MERIAFLVLLAASIALAMKPGGISDVDKPITPELLAKLQSVQGEVEAEVEDAVNGPVWNLVPVTYKSQVVAGVNYFVRYRVNKSNVYYDVRIFQDLHHVLKVVKISGPKTESEPILYFE